MTQSEISQVLALVKAESEETTLCYFSQYWGQNLDGQRATDRALPLS